MVCRIGQETVQEIISRTHEVFTYLRVLQPPYGSQGADKNFYEKQQRLQEVLGGITTHFKRLRVCWDKANVRMILLIFHSRYKFHHEQHKKIHTYYT